MHLANTTLIYLGSLYCLMDRFFGRVYPVDRPVIAYSMTRLVMVLGGCYAVTSHTCNIFIKCDVKK